MYSSKIISSKSSLVGLKAELLKKQEEIKKIKELQQDYIKPLPKQKKKSETHKINEGVENRNLKDLESLEDFDSLKKSREVLEAKTRLYEKLKNDDGERDLKTKYLIDFGLKQEIYQTQEVTKAQEEPCTRDDDETYSDNNSDPENDWVDFVDTLGRSRRCLRKDLPEIKYDDAKLAASLRPPSPPPPADPTPEMLSWDMQREIMRKKWEEQEKVLLGKKDIHYQDVRFDEARRHGVGYFDFSMDENERCQQQQDLKNLRTETLEQQEAAIGLRARRQQQLQARLAAAHKRRRERLGLPPEESELPCETENTTSDHVKEQTKEEKIEDIEESIKKITPVRPWDVGKQGVNRVMTQEEWVEIKRQERPTEFAPPNFSEIINIEPLRKNELFYNSTSTYKPLREMPNHYSKTRETIIVNDLKETVDKNNPVSSKNLDEELYNKQNSCQNDSFENKTAKESSLYKLKHAKKTPEEINALLLKYKEKCYYYPETENTQTKLDEFQSVSSGNKTVEEGGGPSLEDWKTSRENNRLFSCERIGRSNISGNDTAINNPNKGLNIRRSCIDDEVSQEILQSEEKLNDTKLYKKQVKTKKLQKPTFMNNCETLNSFSVRANSTFQNPNKRKWAEIPPPASMSYYSNDTAFNNKKTSCNMNLEDSISVGLNYLKNQTQKKDKKKLKGLLDVI